ncbi:MAG: hypothetical protein ACRDPA_14540, partial [Solirubrobacteraceae bacterium]
MIVVLRLLLARVPRLPSRGRGRQSSSWPAPNGAAGWGREDGWLPGEIAFAVQFDRCRGALLAPYDRQAFWIVQGARISVYAHDYLSTPPVFSWEAPSAPKR